MTKQVIFSGHLIDAPDREKPRFPAGEEHYVRKKLAHLLRELYTAGPFKGLASAAAGGDILFLEVCCEIGVPVSIYLPSAPEEFRKESVDFAHGDWGKRFDLILQQVPYHVLETNRHLRDSNVYTLTNQWIFEEAQQFPGDEILLIALWDGKKGDGSGGTWEMVKTCKSHGIAVEQIWPSANLTS